MSRIDRRLKQIIVVVLALFALSNVRAADSQIRIDGHSQDSTAAGIQAMYAAHDNRDKCLLETAILRIQVGDQAAQAARTGDRHAQATPLGPKINGMTYGQILEFSQKYPDKVKGLCRN